MLILHSLCELLYVIVFGYQCVMHSCTNGRAVCTTCHHGAGPSPSWGRTSIDRSYLQFTVPCRCWPMFRPVSHSGRRSTWSSGPSTLQLKRRRRNSPANFAKKCSMCHKPTRCSMCRWCGLSAVKPIIYCTYTHFL